MKEMKTLYILRHAKSSWDDFRLDDHDRELLPVGIERTRKIARWLIKNKKVLPERIISSSAVRAEETAKIMAAGLDYPVDQISIDPDFYHGGPDKILEKLYALPNNLNRVMIVGHNMTFNDLSNDFLDWEHQIENLPTSGVVCVKINTGKWEEIASAKSELDFMIFPKMLKNKKR